MERVVCVVILALSVLSVSTARLLHSDTLLNMAALDPGLNSAVIKGLTNPKEPCSDENDTTVTLRLKHAGMHGDVERKDSEFEALPKGTVTPSGPNPSTNRDELTQQRLSKSHRSPGVGHMQVFPKRKGKHAHDQKKKKVLPVQLKSGQS